MSEKGNLTNIINLMVIEVFKKYLTISLKIRKIYKQGLKKNELKTD